MNAQRSTTTPGGFTLIELTLAMAMIGDARAVAVHARCTSPRARQRTADGDGRADAHDHRSPSDVLRQDFESVLPPTGHPRRAVRRRCTRPRASGATATRSSSSRSAPIAPVRRCCRSSEGIRRIELLVRTDVTPPVLVRRVTRNLLPPGRSRRPRKKSSAATCARSRCATSTGLTWQENWDSTTLGDVLPMSVAMTLELNDPDRADAGSRPSRRVDARHPALAAQSRSTRFGRREAWMRRHPSPLAPRNGADRRDGRHVRAGRRRVLVLCRSMRVEALASANLAAAVQASAVERGAEQYVLALITERRRRAFATLAEEQFAAVRVGDGFFWILRPDYDDETLPLFGLIEESSKLNINDRRDRLTTSSSRLPGMTYDAASSIMDWIDERQQPSSATAPRGRVLPGLAASRTTARTATSRRSKSCCWSAG